ncbi:PQQ-dependent sugar dehydrogenase [Microbacterium sp. W1N]|uniref:PQQ-dependent sugar dehydrogenase n=1 Tax=Microbacterium festucae TaxID=2977531 RepID=UPI0021BE6965|nr:PQQ-dependent sugar dehydrogenase [Microbacterium festucae]MCT9821264.1 PQQ-dependent sugar dehydrogenase [Microbacterium festucae]
MSLAAAAIVTLAGCTAAGPDAGATASASPTATPAAGLPATSPSAPVETAPTGEVDEIATGLASPWSVVAVDGGVLVSSRDGGQIVEVVGDSTRVVGMVPGVAHGGEAGLLGLAVDGDGRLYAASTGEDGNRVQRFTLTGSPGSFGLGPAETVLDGIPAARVHDGGRLAFGPDGMLYLTTGDAGDRTAAQDPQSLAGKILRMTPDGGVPADNPFPGSLVYTLGHRNPQGIAWDADGTMYAAEFGQNTWDELNVIRAGGNYGWPEVEGAAGDARFVDPVAQWAPETASPSGIAIAQGTLFLANLRGEVLRAVSLADPSRTVDHHLGAFGRLRDVVLAPDGALLVLTGNTDGRGDPGASDDRMLRLPLTTR